MRTLPVCKSRLSIIAASVAVLVLQGCSDDSRQQASEERQAPASASAESRHPVTGERLAGEQTFTHRLGRPIESLDPHQVEDPDIAFIVRDLFEGLLNTGPQGTLIPGVARRYEIRDGNTTWVFHLRDDARWSDGTPVTAQDFVHAWRRAINAAEASPHAWYFREMGIAGAAAILDGEASPSTLGVTATDDHTLTVRLSRPSAHLASMVTHTVTYPLPRHLSGDPWDAPIQLDDVIGNGAFVLGEIDDSSLVRLRNETYWDNEDTLLNRITARVVDSDEQAIDDFGTGDIDYTRLTDEQYRSLEGNRPEESRSIPRLCTYFYAFNTDRAPLDDPRVRRALSHTIDRESLTNTILQGGQRPTFGLVPPETARFTPPDRPVQRMPQAERDRLARNELAEAGYGPENPLQARLFYDQSENHAALADAIASRWRDVLGAEITLEASPWDTFLERRGNGEFDIARSGWCGDFNAAPAFLDLLRSDSEFNDTRYASEAYNRLSEEARRSSDPAAHYTDMASMIAGDAPVAPIFQYTDTFLLNTQIKGWPVQDPQQHVSGRTLYRALE